MHRTVVTEGRDHLLQVRTGTSWQDTRPWLTVEQEDSEKAPWPGTPLEEVFSSFSPAPAQSTACICITLEF